MMDQPQLTEAQRDLVDALDDTAEHVAYEFDPDEWQGISTIGFAHVHGINGNGSFVRRTKSAADCGAIPWIQSGRNDGYRIEIGSLELSCRPAHGGGYRLSLTNVSDLMPGPEMQRLDVRERLHQLVLERLREHGYLTDAYVTSRAD